MSNWNLLKRILEKRNTALEEERKRANLPRVDKDLPLGLRINGFVEIPKIDFIMGESDGLKIKHPGDTCNVLSYGQIFIASSQVHRFYLGGDKDTVFTLQLVTDKRNNIEECKLFMPWDEIYPDDWGFWLDEQSGYIGYSAFQLAGNADINLDEANKTLEKLVSQIEALQEVGQFEAAKKKQAEFDALKLKADNAVVVYGRVWENQAQERVVPDGEGLTRIPPVELVETLYKDPYGLEKEKIKYSSMLYGRQVNENTDEFLLLSLIEDQDGAAIQIMLGIELTPAALKVI
jgi:Protein of unknown function (DUF2491)